MMSAAATAKNTGNQTFGVRWHAQGFIPDRERFGDLLRHPGKYIEGWDVEEVGPGKIVLLPKLNLVVDTGVERSLDKLAGITGTPSIPAGNLVRMGMDNGTTNPVAGSRSSDQGGGADTGSSTQTLRTFDSTPTRSNKIVTFLGTFNDTTTGGIGAVGFIMKRLFLSAHTANITNTTAADSQDTLYSMTNVFTIDFTGISTWAATFSATLVGAGS